MKIATDNNDGAVVLYPTAKPPRRSYTTVRDVTPEMQDVIDNLPEGHRLLWDNAAGELITEPIPKQVPQSVTPRQMRLALIANGIDIDAVKAQVDAIPDPAQRQAAQVEWEYALDVKRTHPLIEMLAQGLGFTDSQVDDLFIAASAL
jgi:hypothetical protein